MSLRVIVLLVVTLWVQRIYAQVEDKETGSKHVIIGVVKDADSKIAIPYCNLIIENSFIGTSTDESGKFKITLTQNLPVRLVVVNVGYKTDTIEITTTKYNYQVLLHSTNKILKEVVVTEYSREYLIKEEPGPIKLVSAKAIDQSSESNIVDVLVKNVPGLNAVKTGPNVSKPFIHGLGYNRIETTYDQVPIEGQQFEDEEVLPVDMYNINNAEVTLGPTCLLDGPDALAGLISLYPPMPTELDKKIHGRALSEYQSNNGFFGNALRLNYGSGYWGYAMSGSYRIAKNYSNQLDGYVYNTGFREINGSATIIRKSFNGTSSLNFTLYDNSQGIPDGSRDSVTRKFTKQVADDPFDDIYSRPVVSNEELNSYKLSPLYQHIQHYRIYSNNEYTFSNGGSIEAMTSFQQNVRREFNSPVKTDQLGVSMRLNSWNYDFLYNFKKTGRRELSAGLIGMYQVNTNVESHDIPIPDYHLLDVGSFIFSKWKYSKWTLSTGVGYNSRHCTGKDFYTRKDSTGLISQAIVPDTAGANLLFPAFKKQFDGFFADAGATFMINDHASFKINLARGSGSPHVSEFASNGIDESAHSYFIGKPDLVPEYCWQADIGSSISYKDYDASVSLFYNDMQKFIYLLQLTDKNGNPVELVSGYKTYQYQQGAAMLYGIESTLNIHPKNLKGFSWTNYFSLVYGFNIESQFKNKGINGEYLPNIPPLKLVSTITQIFKTKSNVITQFGFLADVDINGAQNKYLALNETETATAGYSLFGVGARCNIKYSKKNTLLIQFQVTNLFDEVYQSNLSRLKYFEYYSYSPNGHYGIYNMGRSFCWKVIVPF